MRILAIITKVFMVIFGLVILDGCGNKSKPEDVITNSIGMKLVYIPSGSFMMGSNDGSDVKPVHEVTISESFWMGVCEVTQEQYEAVMGTNPSAFDGDNLPVESISWNDAIEFCEKLSEKEDRIYSLPTEAQWEYACRAGTTTSYYFGDSSLRLGDYAWYYDNSENKTHPVGKKLPNAFGLYDMHGNVWECCQDWYGSYSSSSVVDPTGPSSGQYRVLRGGSWGYYAENCRSATRDAGSPGATHRNRGFRVTVQDFQ